MAKVRVAGLASHFGAHHSIRAIFDESNGAAIGWLPERWPAAARMKLFIRAEEFGATGSAGVDAFGLGIGVLANKCRFGACFTQDMKLLRSENLSPLVVAAVHEMTLSHHNGSVRVLIAPDSFAGSLSAPDAAEAIAKGWRAGAPHDEVSVLPLSDGGPGFLDVFEGRIEIVKVSGPLGDPVDARILLDRSTAYIESAEACGRHLLSALTSETFQNGTTRGVGQLLKAALSIEGVERIVIGLGGSATNDAGRGLIESFGSVDDAKAALANVELVVATDVDNPLLGPQGAAAVYGPQKGATPTDVDDVESKVSEWVNQLGAQQISQRAGAGAAGGLGFALLLMGGIRTSGIEFVSKSTDLQERVKSADLVITGEGSFDWQSLRGKVVSGVAHFASRAGVPVIVLAGQVLTGRREFSALGIESAYALAETPHEVAVAMADAAGLLEKRAARLARSWSPSPVK